MNILFAWGPSVLYGADLDKICIESSNEKLSGEKLISFYQKDERDRAETQRSGTAV